MRLKLSMISKILTMIMTKNKKKIIAFAGRQRSGKTQLAKLLKNEDDAVIVTIASALKKLCCDILGIDSVDRLNY